MNELYKLQKVPLESINTKDSFYWLHNHQEKKSDFFQTNPLIQPVWLRRVQTDNYQIVDGFSVVKVLLEINRLGDIPAMVFDDSQDLCELWIYRVRKRIYENNLSPFCLLEALQKISNKDFEVKKNREIDKLLRKIGFIKPENILKRLDNLQTILPLILPFTQPCTLGCREIEQLFLKNENQLKVLAELLSGFTLKGNKLLTLLQLINEIEVGFQQSLPDILETNPSLLEKKDRPDNYRYNRIKTQLHKIRYPQLCVMEKQWEKVMKKINFPHGISMIHDPYFEEEKLQIQINSRSPEDLNELLLHLNKKLDQNARDEIFKFL